MISLIRLLQLSSWQKIIIIIISLVTLTTTVLVQGQQPKQQLLTPCPHAIKINTNYQFRNSLHFICLQSTLTRPKLEVIEYNTKEVIMSKEVDELDTNQLASFVDDDGTLRILLAVPNKVNGTSMYSIDYNKIVLPETHTINTQFVSSMSIWKLELNWDWHLAIANQPSYESAITYDNVPNQLSNPSLLGGGAHSILEPLPMITIHSWRSTYFDSYQLIKLPQDGRVNKLEPMYINGQEFLIVAMEPYRLAHNNINPQANPSINSLIYKLDFSQGDLNWKLFQPIKTTLAMDVRTFTITHSGSLQRDYYIAILGQVNRRDVPTYSSNERSNNDNRATSNENYGLIIYKYMGDQFMLTHLISAQGATKLDTISYGAGDSYVIIALLSGWSNQVSLYLFDGLTLKTMPAPQLQQYHHQQQPHHYRNARRTLDMANLHLFMVPTNQQEQFLSNDTSQKRTMTGPATATSDVLIQSMTMPALAISKSNLNSGFLNNNNSQNLRNNDMNTPSSIESVYQIPVNDLINENEKHHSQEEEKHKQEQQQFGEDTNHRKRNYYGMNNSGLELLNWCKLTINSLLGDSFDQVAKQISVLPRIDQQRPIELNGDLIIEDELHISNLLYANNIKDMKNTQQSFPSIYYSNYSNTFEQIQLAHNEIDFVKRRVDQLLVDDGSQQDVFQPLTFDTIIIECLNPINLDPRLLHGSPYSGLTCPNINEIRTINLNSKNITNIQEQALLTGRSMTITSDVRFEHLILRGTVDILATLNDLHIDDIVFKVGTSKLPIIGHKHFHSGLYSSSNLLVDQWNGFPVNRSYYLLSTGEQRIDANIRVNQVVIDSLAPFINNTSTRIERLNGIYLDMHLGQIALADDPEIIFEVPIYFDELHLNGPIDFKAHSLLSSINIDELWLTTMFKHSNQNITVPIEFAGDVYVTYGGDIIVDDLVNNIPFRPDIIMMRNGQYILTNPLVVEGSLLVKDLIIDKALNGIQVAINGFNKSQKELSILMDGIDQVATGDKMFNEIYLGGNSIINGNINGHLNLTELHMLANNQGEPHKFSTIHLTGKDIRVQDKIQIHIVSTVNGVPTNDLCQLAMNISLRPNNTFIQYNRLRFEDMIDFKSLRCSSINGFNNLTNSFLTRYGNQNVAGTLKLANGVIFNSTINIHTSLNNLNISPLGRAISQRINDTRTGVRNFYGDIILDDLITDRINNLQMNNIFLAKSDYPQIVRAKMIFDHLDIENVLIVGRNLITNSFNGLNITDLIFNSMQYDTPQEIYNHVEVNTLQLLPNSDLMTKNLNGFDLQKLYADSVLIDIPQQILAPKTFRSPVEFTNRLFLRHGIDGLTDEELRFNLLLHSDELIEGDLEFNNDVYIKKELEILSGIINDIDVNLFVDSMLYENPTNKNGLRIYGNGSVRFNDVKLNNLVVAGTIQGIDVSKEALTRNENVNGTYNDRISEQQFINNNQRFLNSYGQQDSNFKVFSNYRGFNHTGNCFIHSCSKTTIQPPIILSSSPPMPATSIINNQTPPLLTTPMRPNYPLTTPVYPWILNQQQQYVPLRYINQTNYYQPHIIPPPQPIKYVQYFYPNMLPKPMNLINATWRPNWHLIDMPQHQQQQLTFINQTKQNNYPLVNSKYMEYKAILQAQAIKDLARNINRYLSVSFYYEIVQKHPLMGPLLNAVNNPISDDGALLLLKATGKLGEPCLQKGQTIAVMSQQKQRKSWPAFTQSSLVQETSNPILVDSVIVNQEQHYLVIFERGIDLPSQISIFLWDYQSGRYELREIIPIDGLPTALKVFSVNNNNIACIALAMPKVVNGNTTGSPILYCQQKMKGEFNTKRLVLGIPNVFDLDVIVTAANGGGTQILLATLSQHDTEQIGNLNVDTYDVASNSLNNLAKRRLARPMKLHFFRGGPSKLFPIQLVVSEAITSNDDIEALTRIFSLIVIPGGYPLNQLYANTTRLHETQIIRDNQFYNIQTVQLDNINSMIFLQSEHFISIYAPTRQIPYYNDINNCGPQYSLIQRLPTKGANKFLVFNDNSSANSSIQSVPAPFGHFLVLSIDNCEQQKYSTIILKARFS